MSQAPGNPGQPSDKKDPAEVRAELQASLDHAEWAWLSPFAKRGAVILVDASLDLVDAGVKVVLDDKTAVGAWLENGLMKKPTEGQITDWDREAKLRFAIVVVQPYVLAQERVYH